METNFVPAEGITVFYEKYTGVIKFVGENYLTLCVKVRSYDMVSDVCLLIYKEDWDKIQLPKRTDR